MRERDRSIKYFFVVMLLFFYLLEATSLGVGKLLDKGYHLIYSFYWVKHLLIEMCPDLNLSNAHGNIQQEELRFSFCKHHVTSASI